MDYSQDFNAQWKELSAIVESEVIREIHTYNKIDTCKLDALFEEEKSKWSSKINYRGIWLQSVHKTDSVVAHNISEALQGQKLIHPKCKMPSKSKYYVSSLLVLLTIIICTQIIELAWWQLLFGSILLWGGVTAMIVSVYQSSKKRAIDKIRKAYSDTLKGLRSQIPTM